ncbi:hypothetical protein CXB51_002885 [Gossypium anomalum]|uniref:Reverse transcriptase zinc-binding domain-containing protein n=1 Tax=Gossypium anomalum TaxID=47600 RepID=A0A8J5Z1R0_9ROSI|nr:hypothetical protein CXB51_002885 [Gossypium anomalum]
MKGRLGFFQFGSIIKTILETNSKTKYLIAIKCGRSYWTWSNLMGAKEIMKVSLLWQVFNGDKVELWEDRLNIRIEGYRLRRPDNDHGLVPNMVVDKLLKEDKRWDLTSSYTVTSGYKVLRVKIRNERLDKQSSCKIDKRIWKIHNKLKLFLWTCYTNENPTRYSLRRINCTLNPLCELFNQVEKTIEHIPFCLWLGKGYLVRMLL